LKKGNILATIVVLITTAYFALKIAQIRNRFKFNFLSIINDKSRMRKRSQVLHHPSAIVSCRQLNNYCTDYSVSSLYDVRHGIIMWQDITSRIIGFINCHLCRWIFSQIG